MSLLEQALIRGLLNGPKFQLLCDPRGTLNGRSEVWVLPPSRLLIYRILASSPVGRRVGPKHLKNHQSTYVFSLHSILKYCLISCWHTTTRLLHIKMWLHLL